MNTTAFPLVPRPTYETVLRETMNTPSIKVLTGIRRCGKSTLLKMFANKLLDDGIPSQNLLYMKLDSYDAPLEPTPSWLDSILSTGLKASDSEAPFYVFLDEIQEVEGWEHPIRRLYESRRARIYLTGSNAFLLSSDLATLLSGRYIEIHVYPLSFSEYCRFSEEYAKPLERFVASSASLLTASSDANLVAPVPNLNLFNAYLRYGGMPGLFAATDFSEAAVSRELTAIHDTVLLNDVAKRFKMRDIDLLEKLVRYTYTTSGNLFSASKVAGALTSMGRKTIPETVDNYLDALKRAFALYECRQIGLKGKAILQPKRKYYAPDTGLRNLESGFQMQDLGFQLENIVYIELLRRGYEVSIGALPTGEIDFCAQRRSECLYIQVCETLLDEATRTRELASLEALNNSFPKLILTRDDAATGTTDTGIRIISVNDWLLDF